jgi:hypothetical protein
MPYVREVHANLMGAASFEPQAQEADRSPGFQHLIVRACGTPMVCHHGHFLALLGMTANGCIDRPLWRWHGPTDQGEIATPELMRLELCRQMPVTAVVLGHQEQTRRILIQAMHNARSCRSAHARKRWTVVQQRVHQRAVGMAWRRVHHHPRGLVNHQQGRILVDNVEREFLRHGTRWLRRGNMHRNNFSPADAMAGSSGSTRERHLACLDESLYLRTRKVTEVVRQILVETGSGFVSRNFQGVALRAESSRLRA